MSGRYFFFPAADLAAAAALFCALTLLALDCFWEDFFWLDFGDLSPIILYWCRLTGRRNFSFSAGSCILLALAGFVNNRCEIILSTIFGRGGGSHPRGARPKDSCRYLLLSGQNQRCCLCLLDSLSLSRHGESSSEPSSVMILDPAFGNSLEKYKSGQFKIT